MGDVGFVGDASPEGAGEAACPRLDAIVIAWITVATVAWEGFLSHGRGAVFVTEGAAGTITAFRPGPPCACHRQWVEAYDPAEQVVVVVRNGESDNGCIHVVSGWPRPEDAYAESTADALGRVAH